jgi:hypothetical protein
MAFRHILNTDKGQCHSYHDLMLAGRASDGRGVHRLRVQLTTRASFMIRSTSTLLWA